MQYCEKEKQHHLPENLFPKALFQYITHYKYHLLIKIIFVSTKL